MKKAFPWIIVGVILAFLFADWSNSKRKFKDVEREHKESKQISETTIALLNKKVKDKETKIGEINTDLDSANAAIVKLEAEKDKAVAEVAEARKGWEAFSLECRNKLADLDSAWATAFNLSQQEIAKLKEQVKLADERDLYRLGQILDQKNIIAEKDKQNSACEKAQKEIASMYLAEKRASRLKTAAMVGLCVAGFVLGRL